MRNEVFFALLTAWAACWAVVMWVYGQATYSSWRLADGRWRDAPGQCVGFFRWFINELWGDIRHGFHPYIEAMPARYSSGHMLRFFIGISAFVCGMMGVAGATANRDGWPLPVLIVLASSIALSIVAALGHLSVAWRDRPRRWRLFVLAIAVWIPLALWIRS